MPVREGEKKRGQGDGSWEERGDRWRYRVTIGGVQRSFSGATKDEARNKATVARSQYEAGVRRGKDRESLEGYLTRWLADADLRPTARRGYESYIRNHLVPALGKTAIGDLTPDQVQRFIRERQRYVHPKRGPLAARTIRQMHAVLRKALNDAVADRLIPANAAARTRLPRIPYTEIAAMTDEDAHRLLDALRGDRLEALYTIAFAMGLRQGEALGLWWDSVDLAGRTLTVRRTLTRIDGAWDFPEPKTPKSRRVLPIPAEAVPVLQQHWEAMERERPHWRDPHPAPLVFRSERGQPLHAASVTHYFQRTILPKAKLSHMRFHDLRHGCATLLIARGVHPRIVMEILGHSQISLAMNTYGHVAPLITQAAMAEMDSVLRGRLARGLAHEETGH